MQITENIAVKTTTNTRGIIKEEQKVINEETKQEEIKTIEKETRAQSAKPGAKAGRSRATV